MSTSKNIIHPLERSGTCQKERMPAALNPNSFQLAGRSINEMISFAYQIASCLNYYDENNKVNGSWTCFFNSEPTTNLAQICMIDTEMIACKYAE